MTTATPDVSKAYTIREGADLLSRWLHVRISERQLRALVERKRIPFLHHPGPQGQFFFSRRQLRLIKGLYERDLIRVRLPKTVRPD